MPFKRPQDREREEAEARLRRNRNNPTSRFLAPDGDKKAMEDAGIKGEEAVAHFLFIDPSPIYDPKKKKGFNLVGQNGETINAVTARKKPQWLPVEVGHTEADIYVLCFFDGKQKTARLIGWATRAEILACTPRKLTTGGPQNHAVYYTVLRPMEALRQRMVPQTMSLFDIPESDTLGG